MYYNNMTYYPQNMYRQRPQNFGNNRLGGFLFPFALGFVSSPLIFGATRPRPIFGPPYPGPFPGPVPRPYPYYPYY